MINSQLYLKVEQFTKKELDAVLEKIENRKDPCFDEILHEVWKRRKFDNVLLRIYSSVYKHITIEKWTEGCIPSFHKRDKLGITKKYRNLILTVKAIKFCNALLLNSIRLEIKKILMKII